MKTFEQWYNSTKEANSIDESAEDNVPVAKSSASIESDTATVVASPETTGEEGYSKMMQDCDDIINSLKTLSDQLTESEDQTLNEQNPMGAVLMNDPIIMGAVLGLTAVIGAVGLGAKAIKDGAKNKKTIKEAEKDYSKLKKLKMQTVKMEVAVLSLEDKRRELSTTESVEEDSDAKAAKVKAKEKASAANKKKALVKMKAKLDNQIESMSKKKDGIKAASTEYGSSLEVKYSKVSGFGSGKVKTLIADMRDQITTEVSEYKLDAWGDKMSAETKKDLKERISKTKQSQKERMDQIKAEQEKTAKKLDDAAKNDEKVKAELEQIKAEKEKGEEKEKEETPEETPESTPETPEETPKETEEDDFDAFGTDGDDEESPEEETEEVDKADNSKEGMTKRVDAVIAKAEESGDEEKVKKAKELKAKILAKESWQLNNTKLGLIFESDLRKMEMESLIQESISVKDRFSKLI